ncbi:TetR/AcrR family transcriptional regulator [Chitinimonas lacunae]|uniref:TetR/AcrR family transcriptional regulator n=1 Tax=Chitinimonas lacunae TaxID=1963018 RepID=A0ABV8MR03_9NEIS
MSSSIRLTDQKHEAILHAAIAEFRENGFQGTSMDKVALRAGVSKRTVYNHFPSKDELFAEIMAQLWRLSLARIDLSYQPDRPLAEQLRELLWQKMRLLHDEHFLGLVRVAIAEMMHSPERAREMVTRLDEKEEAVGRWVRDAAADGRLKPLDPVFAAQQLQGLLKSFAFWPQLALGQPPLDQAAQTRVIDGCVEMFLSCYGCDKTAGEPD